MQELLVIFAVATAVFYLVRKLYRMHVSEKGKCEGCAVHKIYSMKNMKFTAKAQRHKESL